MWWAKLDPILWKLREKDTWAIWPQGYQWYQGEFWWPQGTQWNQGYQWDTWSQGNQWYQWETWEWTQWNQGYQWNQWFQWPADWPEWPQWPQWDIWSQGNQWYQWDLGNQWNQGYQWDTWSQGNQWYQWDLGNQWNQGYQWNQWDEWNQGNQGNQWAITFASIAEVNTWTETGKAINPDVLAWSNLWTMWFTIIAVDAATSLTVADWKAYVVVPACMNWMKLIRAQAVVNTAGTTNATTIDIYNVTQTADMLSWAISIASAWTVGTVWTIDTDNDDVATNDVLRIDVTSMSTIAPKGLIVVLEFMLP